jgi:DNA-binding winged helix-turn-helix (wHTH) protein/tetratricopeptide (TPR) repeat protein
MAPGHSSDPRRLVPFTVGDWLVEPKACRISRGDTVVKLRPQLTDLLLCLARRAGEIVLKEEILADVWPGQFIAESGLSRCVAELRQSLEDQPHEPRFIETFPKRGYRLIAPVVWLEETEPNRGTAVAEDAVATGIPQPEGRARTGRLWVMAAVVVLVVIAVGMPLLLRSPASALTARDTVLLADVRNTTGDRVFDDTLRLALALNLEQAPFLRIMPREAVRAAVARTGRSPEERVVGPLALDLCRREGGAVLLAASIAPLGSRYAVGIEAIACGSGDEIGRALEEVNDKEHVLEALGRASTRIRKTLGEAPESLLQHDVPLVQATTPSLAALKALTLGDYNRDHARLEDALAFYRQATELDPLFGVAWARRGAAANNLDLREEAVAAVRRAYELRARVTPPEAFYITAHYYRMVAGEPEKAIDTYRAWKRLYPGSVVPPTNLAGALSAWMGQYEAALPEGRESVALAPYSSVSTNVLVTACRGTGRIAEAKAVLGQALARGVDDHFVHLHLLRVALVEGDRAAVEREIQWSAKSSPLGLLIVTHQRALDAMAAGRLRDGRRLFAQAIAAADKTGVARRVAHVRHDEGVAEALVGDARSARQPLDAAITVDPRAETRVFSALVFALLDDGVGRAQALLDGIQPESLEVESRRVWLPVARALLAAARGDTEQARAELRPVRPYERGADFALIPIAVRGIVALRARDFPGAAAAFEEVIRLRAVDPSSPWIAYSRLGLARALRDADDAERSLAAYDSFLDTWKNADSDAPLLKTVQTERASLSR